MKHTVFSLFSAAAFLVLVSVSIATASDIVAQPIGMANPASVFCSQSGGASVIRQEKGGEVGFCELSDGRTVEEWEFFRNSTYDIVATRVPPKDGSADIDAKYPAFRSPVFRRLNRGISFYVTDIIREVKSAANIPDSEGSRHTVFRSSFETHESTNTVSAVVFTEAYLGGAHGVEDIRVFLSRKDGKTLTFRKFLFGNQEALQTFAFRTQLEIIKKYPDLGKKNFVEATDAKWSNFTRVAIDGEEAIVYFATYTLGDRVDGSQNVRVSLK